MPSKGGRRTGTAFAPIASPVLARAVVARSRDEWDVAGFSAAELSRPLRRDTDVQRFNELAALDRELAPEEAEELYRYRLRRVMSRLRQLERANARGDEETIRDAVEDLDARLAELQLHEARLQAAGVHSAYPLELNQREAAIERLLELARRRTPGLVAGTESPPEQPAGSVQVPDPPFRPSPEDVPIYVLAPRSLPSDALARNVNAVAEQGARLRLIHDASEIPAEGEMPPLVLNWGGTDPLPSALVYLNAPEAVRIASDQVESVRRLGELAPRTVLRPDDVRLLGSDRVVAKRRHGARGSGKAVIAADAPWSDRVHHDLFQEFIPDRDEFRLGLLNGRVVSAYAKHAPLRTDPENLRPEWVHEQVNGLPAAALSVAREGARRIELDYAGIDVIVDRSNGRAYCIEANAAPGMSEQTLRNLYAHLQSTMRQRLARAS